ncbi:MAG: hypothetical protein JNJ50_12035 [Acidobacteria bacterium]|nr:hypothetical protein [Acidobacteriota bacterium]
MDNRSLKSKDQYSCNKAVVNYAISLKFDGKIEDAKKVLDSLDWSDTSNDFKLAYKVLSDDYQGASELMRRIGERGDYITEHAYHIWPLFHVFRQTEEFLRAYESIYGYSFTEELQRSNEVAKLEAEIEKKKNELEVAESLSRGSDLDQFVIDDNELDSSIKAGGADAA